MIAWSPPEPAAHPIWQWSVCGHYKTCRATVDGRPKYALWIDERLIGARYCSAAAARAEAERHAQLGDDLATLSMTLRGDAPC